MTRLIKKYKNRRLYDTEKSQYITIEELRHYVIDGLIFRVEEATSGRDLTSTTLLQIFVEMESGATQLASADLLRQLIILAHHPMSKSYKKILEQMMNTIETSLKDTSYLANYQAATEAWGQQMQQILKQWEGFFKKAQ